MSIPPLNPAPTPPTPAPRSFSQRLRRIAWRITRTFVVAYILVLILGCTFQERLIFPGAYSSHGTPEATITPPLSPGAELVYLSIPADSPAGPQTTVALFGRALTAKGDPHPNPASCPTFLYFYGNGMCLADAQNGEFRMFRQLGANVLVPEYTGFGMASGKPSEAGCYAAAEAAYQHLLTRKDIDTQKIVAGGWSLGGAVACDLAAKHPGIAGLFMFSSFTSMDDVAAAHYPFLPIRLLLSHHFRSIDKLPSIRVPILFAHGTADSLVPYAMSLQNKAAATGSPSVTHFAIPGADHNDFYLIGQTEILQALKTLLNTLPPTPPAGTTSSSP